MELKVNDTVCIKDCSSGRKKDYVGEVGVIVAVDENWGCPYEVKFYDKDVQSRNEREGIWLWTADELQRISRFKIGDKVKIPTRKSTGKYLEWSDVVKSAIQGKRYLVIKGIRANGIHVVAHDRHHSGDFFLESDLEPYTEEVGRNGNCTQTLENGDMVIHNGPAVIYFLRENGKVFKGVAKCHPQDKFEFNKGFEIAKHRAYIKYHQWMLSQLTQ